MLASALTTRMNRIDTKCFRTSLDGGNAAYTEAIPQSSTRQSNLPRILRDRVVPSDARDQFVVQEIGKIWIWRQFPCSRFLIGVGNENRNINLSVRCRSPYFFSPAIQLVTTVIVEDRVDSSGTLRRNRCPLAATW